MAKVKQSISKLEAPVEQGVAQAAADAQAAVADGTKASDDAYDIDVLQVQQLRADLRSCQAELKIHKAAWESEAEKYSALSAKSDYEKNKHDAVVAQLQHVIRLIRTAEVAHYDLLTTQEQFDAEGWQRLYQQLVKAVMPVFTYGG